ncbi:hypothetical protein VCRA2119O147_1040008 [Vibrio crassostreae]|nr:hypothetical protein VCRA2119O145_260061 [Vibrio crassostreae]CAK1957999.1 hypothetical protein VCRA2118O144_280060 [Vibrio crassostreae]CAK2239573.1 hypothetical protein VCRA2119O147_1040008 [Vibrio crassostreae]CAK2403158.1 hypothetical protein VCRA2113O415_120072 [Vibrio crassostreae]CAK2551249.1 hypothetical protein VCRA2113O420_130042 [Vibrio crassostreae]
MILHLTIDTTGLNFYGKGEWKIKKHGTNGKRRVVWRKLDIAVNVSTHEIIAAELSLSTVTNGEEAAFGNAVILEISQWVARNYTVQISIGKSGMVTTNAHSQKQQCIELNIRLVAV